MNAVTHLEKVIVGEVSAVTHLEKVIAGETSAVTYTEKVITGEATPITHLQKVIAGVESPVTHLEYVWAGGSPTPTEHEYTGAVPYTFRADGSPLLDYIVYGNMVQDGTPTPDSPVMPQECGDLETEGAKAGQYKIPISSANTTTPVYLGEVQTTRKIKKLVLTGDEDWEVHWSSNSLFTLRTITDYMRARIANLKCSHYVGIITVNGYSNTGNLETALYYNTSTPTTSAFYIRDDNISGVTAFKDFLAQQYAAGTPVTVWYVLATPETAVVNEPLMKIGDYADTLSMEQAGVSIPTNNGSTTVDVDTTLKPSEVYIKYKGV